MSDFIHLHCHSEFSTLDGMPKVEEYLIKVNELGMPGFALTEHGNLRSMFKLYEKCNKEFNFEGKDYDFGKSIKPIIGCEFYFSPVDHRIKGLPQSFRDKLKRKVPDSKQYAEQIKKYEEKYQIRKRWHFLIFAKNETGYKNLLTLHYLSWKNGFYYRPRIDLKLLKKYHEGLVVTSSCVGGAAPQFFLKGDLETSEKHLRAMKKLFGDDYYIEIQPHKLDDQIAANVWLVNMAHELGIKLVATNDCHYLDKDDYKAHEVLLAINSRATMQAQDRWRFGDTGFYLRSKDEMIEAFKKNHPDIPQKVVKTALENTMEIHEKSAIHLNIGKKQGILPKIKVPKQLTENEYLVQLCKKGWKTRQMKKRIGNYAEFKGISYEKAYKEYKQRLKLELNRIIKLNFVKYFIIIQDITNWARENEIMVGPGRGSSAGSLVCFLIGITSIDPIRYDLLFDRFLSSTRIDYPDVDMDFEDRRRKEIFEYIFNKYGEKYVSLVGTTNRMKGKQALQDVGRVYEIPMQETLKVTKHLITRAAGDARNSQTVEDSFKEFEVSKNYNKQYPQVLPMVKKIEGKAKSVGIHPAAVQITPFPIYKYTPIEFRKDHSSGEMMPVSSLDYRDCQEQGLIKIDILGLKTLTVIKEALEKIEERHDKKIDLEKIDLENKKVLQAFSDLKFGGIFQYDSIGMRKMCREFTFDNFEDIVAINALYRPGGLRSGQSKVYIGRKQGKVKIKSIHPYYDEITKNSYGTVVYQEQLMQVFMKVAGYQPSKADIVRKKVSKSQGGESLWKEREDFMDGAKKNGVDEKTADWLFKNMSFFGCVSGGTYIHRPSANQYSEEKIKIKDLYDDIQKNKSVKYKIRDGVYKLKCLDESDNKVKRNNVIEVVKTGKKKIYLLKTKSGKTIKCTPEHKLLKAKINKQYRYVELNKLKAGDKILVTDFIRNNSVHKNKGIGKGGRSLGKTYDSQGLGKGKKNINYVDGRKIKSEKLRQFLIEKYNGKCQDCESDKFIEMHHKNFNHKDNRKSNVELLCRCCHRQKHSEQLQRYTNGYLTYNDEIVSIKYKGIEMTYDICMESPNNNYVANDGIIVHNSYAFNKAHSAAYSTIGYWSMWLKLYYTTEFFYGLLKTEKNDDDILNFIREARDFGVEIILPDVNVSETDFAIVDDNIISVGLQDIKGVGKKAADIISKNKPYTSLLDFSNKVERRIVNRGVIKALVKSGAFKSLYENTAALISEHVTIKNKRNGDKQEIIKTTWELMLEAKSEEDAETIFTKAHWANDPLTKEQEERLIATVSPIPTEKHIIEYYKKLDKVFDRSSNGKLKKIKDITLNEDKVLVKGILIDIKYNNVGDFAKEHPDDKQKKRMEWGKRYSTVNIQDETGIIRCNVGIDIFPTFRHIIDMGSGVPVVISARPLKFNGMLFIDMMANLDNIRAVIEDKNLNIKEKYEKLDLFERYFIKNPVSFIKKRHIKLNKANKRKGEMVVTGLITKVKYHWTKKKDEKMAFVEIDDETGSLPVTIWNNVLIANIKKLSIGNIVTLKIMKNDRGSTVNNPKDVKLRKTVYRYVKK